MNVKKVNYEEVFENALEADFILKTIQDAINKYEKVGYTNSQGRKEVIDEFYEKVKDWQIILLEPEDGFKMWLQSSITHHEITETIGFWDRLKIFIRRGIPVGPKITKRATGFQSNIDYPMEIPLGKIHTLIASKSDENKFYYSIVTLLKRIEQLLEEHPMEKLPIYKKPLGIVSMNQITHSLNELKNELGTEISFMKNPMETIMFSDLLKNSEVVFDPLQDILMIEEMRRQYNET